MSVLDELEELAAALKLSGGKNEDEYKHWARLMFRVAHGEKWDIVRRENHQRRFTDKERVTWVI